MELLGVFGSFSTAGDHIIPQWFLFLSNIALGKGQDSEPKYISSRMVFLFMFLASVVLFESFSASYTSFLSVVKEAQPFETISELEQTSYLIGAQSGTAFQSMFSVI